jgi:hypothetical protein
LREKVKTLPAREAWALKSGAASPFFRAAMAGAFAVQNQTTASNDTMIVNFAILIEAS